MAKASDNVFPKVILGPLGTPSAPTDASWKLFPKADGIYAISSNTTVGPFGSGGGGLTGVAHSSNTFTGPTITLNAGTNVAITSPSSNQFTIHSTAQALGSTTVACRAYNNGTSSSLSSGAYRYLTMDSDDRDSEPGSMHDTSTNTSRITVPSTGWYVITGGTWENTSTGNWSLYIRKNGTTTLTPEEFMASANAGQTAVTIAYLAATDYVELAVYFASGTRTFGNNASPDTMTYLAVAKVG